MGDEVEEAIQKRLDAVEASEEVRVLYACESGSRAWGFASADSDYDVRFVYVHPRDWYLSIDLERRDDAIDPPSQEAPIGEIDLHGWDLRKALGLFRSSNPSLLEWLRSPIVYREDEAVMERWRAMIPSYYTRRAAAYAYRGMAGSVARQNLRSEPVTRKAYLYVLRSLLAVRWIEDRDDPVPVRFARLVDATVEADRLRDAIGALLDQKRSGHELGTGPRIPVLHDFIDAELQRLKDVAFEAEWGEETNRLLAPLNTFFREVVMDGEHP